MISLLETATDISLSLKLWEATIDALILREVFTEAHKRQIVADAVAEVSEQPDIDHARVTRVSELLLRGI